jgi:hypothetical protein
MFSDVSVVMLVLVAAVPVVAFAPAPVDPAAPVVAIEFAVCAKGVVLKENITNARDK